MAKAKKLMADAGQADFEHELITVDEDWHKNTGDAIAAQLREAGIKVKRTVLPGSTFWNDWTKYPLLDDHLEHAPARRPGPGARLQHAARPGTRPPIPTPISTPSSTRRSPSRMQTSARR